MEYVTFLLLFIILLALLFDYINGFHDAANAIATVVATKTLSPKIALLLAGGFNFIGAFLFEGVAKTIGKGLVNIEALKHLEIVLAGLVGAIIWNVITWYFGLPSSSSHALIGGLLGAVVAYGGIDYVFWGTVLNKVIVPGILSPILGVIMAFILMVLVTWVVYKLHPRLLSKVFKKLQLISASWMALSHGTNDAQKVMGIITLALVLGGLQSDFNVPFWVKASCATMIGLGTIAGGWRIIRTMGTRVTKLQPIHGFVAETTAGSILMLTGYLGFPVSTTHVITGAIIGVGVSRRASAVRWIVAHNIVVAWILTIPVTAIISGLVLKLMLFIT